MVEALADRTTPLVTTTIQLWSDRDDHPTTYVTTFCGRQINKQVSVTAASGPAAADVLRHRDLNDLW